MKSHFKYALSLLLMLLLLVGLCCAVFAENEVVSVETSQSDTQKTTPETESTQIPMQESVAEVPVPQIPELDLSEATHVLQEESAQEIEEEVVHEDIESTEPEERPSIAEEIPAEQAINEESALAMPVAALEEVSYLFMAKAEEDLTIQEAATEEISDSEATESESDLDDGDYTADVESSSSMFKVIKCVLTKKDNQVQAIITLSGTGYDLLFMGLAADAISGQGIPYVLDEDGLYTFTIPVLALDVPIAIAAHSVSSGNWFDRTLTFKSSSLAPVSGDEPSGDAESTPMPSANPSPAPTLKPESDLNGSTAAIDNKTTLPDGTYIPDKFSCSGGTGKVKWDCTRVTVKGGRSTANISVSSSNYQYVKANGQKYYGSHGGGRSSFTIPVKLNANNTIIGMTTAMSVDREIKYKLYIYIAAAANVGENQYKDSDGAAPPIPGAGEGVRETLSHAKLFTIYRYENQFTLISIEDTGDYLLLPEGTQVPEDIDPDVNVVFVPVRAAFVASDAVHVLLTEDSPSNGYMLEAGTLDLPDYNALLLSNCDLAILPAEALDNAHEDIRNRLEMLGITVLFDRSSEEEDEQARLEWIKIYAHLFGLEVPTP